MYFDSNITDVGSSLPNWLGVDTDLGNDLKRNIFQPNNRTNDDTIQWRISGLGELMFVSRILFLSHLGEKKGKLHRFEHTEILSKNFHSWQW